MGFISSATTTTLNIQLTDKGRSSILNGGNLINLFSKFGISDSDIDYRNTQAHSDTSTTTNDSAQLGYMPDITGEKTTFRNAVNEGYKVRDNIWVKPERTQVQSTNKKYVALGMRQPNGNMKYYRDTCVIDYYIHDLLVLHKLFAFRYVNDYKDTLSINSSTIVGSATTYFETTLDIDTKGEYSQFLGTLSEYGLGMYGNIWDSVKVYDGTSLEAENIRMVSKKDYDYYNSLVLAGGAFIRNGGNGQQTGIEYNGTTIKGFKQASPFSLFFSPGLNSTTKAYKSGAGEASLGLGAFDWGYLNVGGMVPWNTTGNVYPKFIMDNKFNGWAGESTNIRDSYVGFVTTTDMESAISLGTLEADGYKNIDTTLPAARLVLDVATSSLSPVYYPIPPFMMTEANGDLLLINNSGAKGIKITDTQNPTDAYGRIIGLMEYTSNWNTIQSGFKSSGALFNVFPSQAAGQPTTATRVAAGTDPHYTLLGRMLKMADDMFVGISSQSNSFWSTNKYSGGYKNGLSGTSIDNYNVSIPITWVLESTQTKANTTPLNVTVNFIFNKGAITESIKYKNASSQNFYSIYDNAIFKFYGEDGVTRASHSEDPRGYGFTSSGTTSYETSTGKKLFRKLISGQEIKAN
jgi:hypothetical protein|tara:strand:- start:10853 stop:12748 length:1896 start_codon:yes stop_codon:yes gene_type:complete